ncbi:MAG: class II fumarate hydratase [Desulfobacterales bacterium]
MSFREETDSLGTVQVRADALYGAQTSRAVKHFSISGLNMPQELIRAIARIKKAAAGVNSQLKQIPPEYADAIEQAAGEVIKGGLDEHFPVDVFQTGSGTSTNMNVNEVISTRANEILTGTKKTREPVHPNDHVNHGQSTNDVMPSAIHMAALELIRHELIPALGRLEAELEKKSKEFSHIKKIARTHLQDAVVMTLGQEFSGYAEQMHLAGHRVDAAAQRLLRLALGGTAVGTGLNAHPEFAQKVIAALADETGFDFYEAPNHFEAQGACDSAVETSGAVKTVAVSLSKIANDIRWLASGPRCGLGEIRLPELLPGSSIMPGKVNPVMCETAIQACAHVIGNDSAVTTAGQGGYFELNLMLPLIAFKLTESIRILAGASDALAEKCVSGIRADEEKCAGNLEKSLAVVTGLVPHIGYDRAAKLARHAYETRKTIEQAAAEENILPENELKRALYGE